MVDGLPIVVGGCGSSGTTLFVNLLGRHPEIGSGPELSIFNHKEITDFAALRTHYRRWFTGRLPVEGYNQLYRFIGERTFHGIDLGLLNEWIESSKDFRGFLKHLCKHMSGVFGKRYFAEKTPTNVYAFKEIAEAVPEIPIIHVVRDGRDVTASLMRRGYSPFRTGSRWVYDTLAGFRARNSPSYLEIKYEELVSSPSETLEKVFNHLGLSFDQEILEAPAENDSNTSYVKTWNLKPTDQISTSSVGRFKKELNERTLSLLYRIRLKHEASSELQTEQLSFRELLELLNYEVDQEEVVPHSLLHEKRLQVSDWSRRAFNAIVRLQSPPKSVTYISL